MGELRKSLYVDDLVSEKSTVEQVQVLKEGAVEVFNDATLTLHKWHPNKPELGDTTINNEEKSFAKQQLGTPEEDASILGLGWSKDKDEIKVIVPTCEVTTTKRGILSKLA